MSVRVWFTQCPTEEQFAWIKYMLKATRQIVFVHLGPNTRFSQFSDEIEWGLSIPIGKRNCHIIIEKHNPKPTHLFNVKAFNVLHHLERPGEIVLVSGPLSQWLVCPHALHYTKSPWIMGKTNSEFKKIPKAEILRLFGLMKAFKK